MRKRLLSILTIFSLLILAVCIALWVFSYQRWEYIYGRWNLRTATVEFNQGLIRIDVSRSLWSPIPLQFHTSIFQSDSANQFVLPDIWASEGAVVRREFPCSFGFGTVMTRGDGINVPPVQTLYVIFPFWVVAVVCAWPVARVFRPRNKVHPDIANQRCIICGYDLRATPDRCPECGADSLNAK
jgi:hypothetical protein